MNKLIILMMIPFLICCSRSSQLADHRSIYIGMPKQEFLDTIGKKAKLEAMESGYTVYRKTVIHFMTGEVEEDNFYYFDGNDNLYKVDKGQFKQRRYQIEVINE